MAKKQIGEAAAHKLDWFDINNYKECRNMPLHAWCSLLFFRYFARYGFIRSENYSDTVETMLRHPVPEKIRRTEKILFMPKGFPGIWDRSVWDIYGDAMSIRHKSYPHLWTELEACLAPFKDESYSNIWAAFENHGSQNKDASGVIYKSYNELRRELDHDAKNDQVITVNLLASDEQLIEDFSSWLSKKRKVYGINKNKYLKKRVTRSDTKRWARYQVLAYIDLKIYCEWRKIKISDERIGRLLYPDDEVSPSDRIRKVTAPLSENLLDPHFILSFNKQTESAERKSSKNIPE